MFLYRLKRLLLERDILITVIIFGLLVMIADIFADFDYRSLAAATRVLGILILLGISFLDYWLRRRRTNFPVPLMFEEKFSLRENRESFARFLDAADLRRPMKVIEVSSPIRSDDLILAVRGANPRYTADRNIWRNAWRELLNDWLERVDRPLTSTMFSSELRRYHVYPHVVLPLSFALGAAVNLRRSIVLFHMQDEMFRRVIDLSQPRKLHATPDPLTPPVKKIPADFSTLQRSDKLILHLAITDRHGICFEDHAAYQSADNAALSYDFALDPETDWLPYVQRIIQEARPLVERYKSVEICFLCPSAIAFALGMGFSRNSRITVCHRLDGSYVPVFSLSEIEENLMFG